MTVRAAQVQYTCRFIFTQVQHRLCYVEVLNLAPEGD